MWRVGTVGLVGIWFVAPLIPILLWSLASRWQAPSAMPQEWGLAGWSAAAQAGALDAVLRSITLGVIVAAIATPLGAAAGKALAWGRVRSDRLALATLLLPIALPPVAVSMGLDALLLRLGVPDLVGVVVVLSMFALPYTTYAMRATYQQIDPEIEDQALLLGASRRQSRRLVSLPLARTGFALAAGLAFLVGWSDYVVTLVVGGGQVVTLALLIGSAAAGVGNDPTLGALSVIAVLPGVALAIATAWGRNGKFAVGR